MKTLFKSNALRMAAILAVVLPLSSPAFAVKPTPSVEISLLMGQARADAALADKDMTSLETYLLTGVPWQVHFFRLQAIQLHLNDLAKDVNEMEALRSDATPSQQDAINRLDSLVHNMAGSINATIKYLNHNHSEVNMPTFTDRVRANRLLIDSIYNVARAHSPKDNALAAKK